MIAICLFIIISVILCAWWVYREYREFLEQETKDFEHDIGDDIITGIDLRKGEDDNR